MKILVIGGGGREHGLVWKLKQSSGVEKIWCAPGNGGICAEAECVSVSVSDVSGFAEIARRLRPDLTVVGPELPLVLGLADTLRASGLPVLGPGKLGAQLEGSKVFAKRFMEEFGIPTARLYGAYHDLASAQAAVNKCKWPVVIKADGLCGGKGVLVTSSRDEAASFIAGLMDTAKPEGGQKAILLEEALEGTELSYIALTDGENIIPFAPARDHKRAFDGDRGPNTGGMGAFSSDSLLPAELEAQIQENVVVPTLRGLALREISYRGFLYLGLMLTSDGPKVLEYNCRMGDPEAQAILPRADFDLAGALLGASLGDLSSVRAKWKKGAAVCVVLAARGYPEKPELGAKITGLDVVDLDDRVVVFHAGTRRESGDYYVSGGRVLGVSGTGESAGEAHDLAYDRISRIGFQGMHYRGDICITESSAVSERGRRASG